MASMTKDRFEEIADAYGGEVARWPAEAREDAAVLMADDPGFTQAVLERARALDSALDAWRPPAPSGTLAERIASSAPRPRPQWTRWLSPAVLGAGLAAAGVAGAIVGVQLSGRVADRVAQHRAEQTAEARTAADAVADVEEGA